MTHPTYPSGGRHQVGTETARWAQLGPRSIPRQARGYDEQPDPDDLGWAPRPADPGPDRPAGPDRDWSDPYGYREPPPVPAWQQPDKPWLQPAEVTADAVAWASLRKQIADRLRIFNGRHCTEAFELYRTKGAISPHAVILFYVDVSQHPYALRIVRRLWLAGPDATDLSSLLAELTEIARINIADADAAGSRWDPRGPERSMINGGDMDMPADATFIGAGVSTLDTPQLDWEHAARDARTGLEIPGRCVAILSDGTAMRIERRPQMHYGDTGIYSNRTLDPERRSQRYWNIDPYRDEDLSLRDVWHRLAELQDVLQAYLRQAWES